MLKLYDDKMYITVAEWSWRTYPAPLGAGGVGSIPANPDAQNVPSFRRRRFEMKLSPFKMYIIQSLVVCSCVSHSLFQEHHQEYYIYILASDIIEIMNMWTLRT